MYANLHSGTTICLGVGIYQLTIDSTTNAADASNGDLDINANMTIQGVSAASTIIQGNFPVSDGKDNKIFGVNQDGSHDGLIVTIDKVTISGGRNSVANGDPSFAYTGGGIDFFLTGTGVAYTLNDCIVTNNTNVHAYGGGINIDSAGDGSHAVIGNVTINNCTISNNSTQDSNMSGAGVNLFSDRHNVTISNSTISNNVAARSGGGLFIRHSFGGVIGIHNTTISGNSAAQNGGGMFIASLSGLNSQAVTIDQKSVIQNNTSGTSNAAFSLGQGGGIDGSANAFNTLSIDKATITGNQVSANAPDQRGGGGIAWNGPLTMHNSRIVGNNGGSAGASGLRVDSNGSGTVDVINNWWGCNAGPSSAPCDRIQLLGSGGGAPVVNSNPWIVLTLAGSPTALTPGATSSLTADFLHTNSGVIALANIDVLLGLPVTWGATNGSLSGQQATIQNNGQATATYTQGSNCNNGSATAQVDSGVPSVTLTVTCPNLKAAKTNSVGGSGTLSTPWTWSVKVDNIGTAAATFQSGEVILRDNLPSSNITYGSASVAAGSSGISGTGSILCSIAGNVLTCSANGGTVIVASATATFTAQFTATATAPGSFANPTGGVCRSDPDTLLVESSEVDNDCSDSVTVAAPDLTITKTHAGNFSQGQTGAQYTITVTNSGPGSTVGTVTVTEAPPVGMTVTAMIGTGWVCTPPAGPCTRSDALAAAASYPTITVTVNVAANAGPSLVNSATVSGGGETNVGNDTANDTTTVTGVALLSITKTHAGNFTQGQVGATYTVTVSNTTGSAATSGVVTVTDTLPAGFTPTAATGTGWGPGVNSCTIAAQVVTCTRSDALAGGSSYPAITVTATIAGNATTQTNTATVTGGGDPNPHSANDPTTVIALAGLSITKTHSGTFTQGDTGKTYSVTVTNGPAGGSTAGTVTVTDTLPPGFTPTAATGTGWGPGVNACSIAAQVVTCSRADVLNAGASYPAITITVNIAGNATTQTNTATVTGGGDPNPHSANDPTTVNPAAPASGTFTVNKVFAPASGASVQITLTCTSGTVVASPLPATQVAPAMFTVNAIGAGNTCTATEAVPAGYTANQAPCAAVALAPGGNANCTITNVQNAATSGTFTVNKVFAPASGASVQISLTCTAGTVVTSPLPATQVAPAMFTVNTIGAGNTCTATETVPAGYTANQASCAAVALAAGGNANCTITNTQNAAPTSGTFTVNKVFSPVSGASVQVSLTCTSGTVAASPLPASQAVPAVFTVNAIGAGNTCTATETVPAGYTANQAPCLNQVLTPGGATSCTITNTQTTVAGPCAVGGPTAGGSPGAGGPTAGDSTGAGGGPAAGSPCVGAPAAGGPN